MKKLIISCIIAVISYYVFSQTTDWIWAIQSGDSHSSAIATDIQGNQYITGYFGETLTLGSTTLISNGHEDIFVAKLDVNGNWQWAVSAGGTESDFVNSIAVDDGSNLCIAGSFSGTATFGTNSLAYDGTRDIFYAKLDSMGNWIWVKQVLSAENAQCTGIKFDNAGNIYMGGMFSDSISFQETTLNENQTNIFVAKMDSSGNCLWASQTAGNTSNECFGLAVDSEANIYITGYIFGNTTFGAISLTTESNCTFVAKLDNQGNWLWAVNAVSLSYSVGEDIVIDSAANIYITGLYSYSTSFGQFELNPIGSFDIFIVKLDTNGNWLWAKQAGGLSSDKGVGIAVDNSSSVYVTGRIESTSTFGTTTLSSRGGFITKLDSDGNWQWAMNAGGPTAYGDNSIAIDTASNVYITGWFSATATFGNTTLVCPDIMNSFIAKLGTVITSADDVVAEVPGLSVLYDAYPNPLRSRQLACIKTEIASKESGILTVYNSKGQCMVSYRLGSGIHQINLDSTSLTSGVYFYRLKTTSSSMTKKLFIYK